VSGLYNLGTGESRSFSDLARSLCVAVGVEFKMEIIEMPAAIRDRYQYFTQAEMTKLRQAGYDRPFASIEDGVRRYVQDYLMQPDPYR